jgi:tetratricopeptide (TPR) repeat protein
MAGSRGSRWWERVDRISAAIFAGFVVCAGLARAAGAPAWVMIALAAIGVVGAVLKVVLVSGSERARDRELRDARFAEPPRAIRTMTRTQLYALGVDGEAPEALAELGVSDTSIAYQPREVDELLRPALVNACRSGGARLVVLTGRSKAGKSRCALEAVLAAVRDGWLLVPAPVLRHPDALSEIVGDEPRLDGPIVIWLDDLEDWARPEGLTPGVLRALDKWQRPTIVLATAFGKGARAAAADANRLERALNTLLDHAEKYPLPHLPTASELTQIEDRFGPAIALRLQDEGLGEFLIAARHLVRRFENQPHPVGQAIVRAAIDVRRTGYLDPIPDDWLRAIHGTYHHAFATDADYAAGLRWATERLYANTGLLDRHDLPDGDHGYAPYDYLVSYVEQANHPIPSTTWDHVIERATRWLANIGVAADAAGKSDLVERAFRRGDQLSDPLATFNLGVLFDRKGDSTGAEAAYRRADERGDETAAYNLGVLLQQRGDLEGAEAAYRRADERGSDDAAYNLGVLLEERGDLEGAEAAYRRADERGSDDAACNLGVLLEERGDLEGAEAAYRRGDERGSDGAAYNLGALLRVRDDLKGAEAAWRRGDERGDGPAAYNLGVLLAKRGDLEGAEAAFRRARERGIEPGGSGADS